MGRLSIIIPFYNEAGNVIPVLQEAQRTNPDAEIIAVDDGSSDETAERVAMVDGVICLRLPRNLGQSAALYYGLAHASGDFCAMMDGDGQNDPVDISRLVEEMSRADLVCGYRSKRQDSWSRRAASRFANGLRRALLGDGIRDTGCSLKVMRRVHFPLLVCFNGMHRYIPALLKRHGLKIVEVAVNHRPRKAGESKYTIRGRAWRGIWDLVGVCWLLNRKIDWPCGLPWPERVAEEWRIKDGEWRIGRERGRVR